MLLLNREGSIIEAWFVKADATAREVSRVSSPCPASSICCSAVQKQGLC